MKEKLIDFKTAQLAEELGYNRAFCEYVYDSKGEAHKQYGVRNYPKELFPRFSSAPTQSLLQRWIREEQKIHIEVWYNFFRKHWEYTLFNLSKTYDSKKRTINVVDRLKSAPTYEEALEAGLLKTLSYIKG